jgi:membrane fusion protein, macrolide-specific efflux system
MMAIFKNPEKKMNLSSHKKIPLYKQPKWILIAIVILLGFIFIWRTFIATDENEPVYTAEAVVRGDIENLVTATGILQPQDYVDVGAQVSGILKKLHVEVGDEVKVGDLLAEIDATVYAARVDGTRAQLQNQQAQLLDKQAQLTLAEINFQRQQNLKNEDATSTETLQSAEANLKSAQAQLKSLQAQIKQTESSLKVEAANLNYAKIYSPINGTVVSITSRQGQTLNTNQMAPTIMRIADLSTMTVQTQVSEADISKLKEKMPVYFTTLGSQGRRWYSQLDRIQPTPEVLNNVVLYNALFDVPNENRLLMTQMSTQVFFIESQAKNVLLVPMSALSFSGAGDAKKDWKNKSPEDRNKIREQNRNHDSFVKSGFGDKRIREATVKIMKEDDVIEERKVKVGVTNRVQAEIIEGLQEGEQVVSSITRPNQVAKAAAMGGGFGGMGRR